MADRSGVAGKRYPNRCTKRRTSSSGFVFLPREWQPRMPEQLDEEELADWRAGRNAVYQLAALSIGARLAVGCRRKVEMSPAVQS